MNIKYSYNYIVGKYTCQLLSSVINDTEPPELPENININHLYEYQLTQNVTNIAYVALERLSPSLNLKEYQLDYKFNILREARFEIAGQEIYSTFEKEEIHFLPLKGAILKSYYPKPSLRTFTDTDIYVGENFDKAEKVLLGLGFEKLVDTNNNDVSYVKKPSLHIELHKELFPADYAFNGYFSNPYKHTIIKEGYEYFHLYYDDDFFIYVFCHLYKHYTYGGCGLRQFLDIYVMLQKFSLNMEYIRSELNSIGLEGFLDTTLKLTGYLFDNDEPSAELMEIAEFVFSNGTFGNADNRLVLDYDKAHGKKRTLWGNIKYFMERWGLNYSQMKWRYKVLNYLPFLLPFCWLFRLITALLFRRDVIKASVDDVGKMNSEFSDYINHIMDISNANVGDTNKTKD